MKIKMASVGGNGGEEEFVRLSHTELVKLSKAKSPAKTTDEDSRSSGKKYEERTKKPERPIYMPGQMRFSRRKENADQLLQPEFGTGGDQSENLIRRAAELDELGFGNPENDFHIQGSNSSGRNFKASSAKSNSSRQNSTFCYAASPDNEAIRQSGERLQQNHSNSPSNRFTPDRDAKYFNYCDIPSVDSKENQNDGTEFESRRPDEKRERKKEKKPDIQIYVPKRRQQLLPAKDPEIEPVSLRDTNKARTGVDGDFKEVSHINSSGAVKAVSSVETELNAAQIQKALQSGNGKRKVTMKESAVEVTISRQKEEKSEGKQSVVKSKNKKQPKSLHRQADRCGQHSVHACNKAVHNGRSPRQRLNHWRQASGIGNEAEELGDEDVSDMEEVEELEWDHQADLDLNDSQVGGNAALVVERRETGDVHKGQYDDDDEDGLFDAEPRSGVSPLKPAPRRKPRRPRKRRSRTKHSDTTENETAENNSDAIKDQTVNSNQENPASKVNSLPDNIMSKLDVLVITNSKRHDSLSTTGSNSPQKQPTVRRENNGDNVRSRIDREPDENLSRGFTEKTRVEKKNVQERKPMGMKYSGSKGGRTSDSKDISSGENPSCNQQRKKSESEEKTDTQESDRLSLSDITLSTRVGGIIRLPVGTSTSADPKPDHSARHSSHGSKNYGRVRAQGRRTLWDPNQHSRGSNSPEILPNYYDTPGGERSSHFPSGTEMNSLRDYEYGLPSHPSSHPPQSPFYNTFPRCLPVEGYGYRYPVPGPCFDGAPYDSNLMRDLYFQGYGDQSTMNVQSMPSPQLTNLVREAVMFDTQLSNLISHGVNSEENLKRMTNLRLEILSRYEQAMLLDLDFCNQQSIAESMWRSAFYQVIEVFRKQMKEQDCEGNRRHLMAVLDEGIDFLEKFLQKLQAKYNFTLGRYLDVEQEVPECGSRTVKLALITCQRIMMCLGDLARYKELTNQSLNYGRARNYYVKAQQIAPKNGKPYNQLAVLALYTKRQLDAVYYYMRSLAATNPLLTARESLMSLFEEVRRKMEQTEKTRQMEKAQRKHARSKLRASDQSHRLEIWISSDGTSSQDQVRDDEDDSDDILGLSVVELNKRFALSFLHVHGKLFTKIGMESFPESVGRMLREFQVLVSHSPSPIGSTRLLQLMTINMFAIENTIRRETSNIDDGCRSLIQEQAMQLGLEMFGLVIEQCIRLISDHLKLCGKNTKKTVAFGEDLRLLLPAVKTWSDWMICHNHLWNPPPIPFDPLLGPNVEAWKLMADLFNIISEIDTSAVTLLDAKTEGCKVVLLPEDLMLAGFVPLLSITRSPCFVSKDVDKDLAQDCLRIDKLRMFAEVVYGLDPAILSYSAETRLYTSLVESESKENVSMKKISSNGEQTSLEKQDSDDVIVESESIEFCGSDNDSQEHHISQLKARKQELTRKMAEQVKKQESLQAAIEHSHHDFRRIELEIRPVFLVLDTNCLIDHLRSIMKLLGTRKYTVIIPLVVINELDGLAKSPKENCYDTVEHAEMVRMGARNAITFLEAEFECRNPHLKAVTSKGSTLDTIAFRSEEPLNAGTNDDLILNCCLRYCQDKARDFMPKSSDEPIHLYRDVVLLTNDRNLRLKAHLHNVPVKDVPNFLRWANIS